MNRDKQIEETAQDICGYCAGGICILDSRKCDLKCSYHEIVEKCYNAGYRKASDVAREIFEEIEKLISSECLVIKDENGIRGYVDASVHYILAELKKKYESEGEG